MLAFLFIPSTWLSVPKGWTQYHISTSPTVPWKILAHNTCYVNICWAEFILEFLCSSRLRLFLIIGYLDTKWSTSTTPDGSVDQTLHKKNICHLWIPAKIFICLGPVKIHLCINRKKASVLKACWRFPIWSLPSSQSALNSLMTKRLELICYRILSYQPL